jgi:hypothetical protein
MEAHIYILDAFHSLRTAKCWVLYFFDDAGRLPNFSVPPPPPPPSLCPSAARHASSPIYRAFPQPATTARVWESSHAHAAGRPCCRPVSDLNLRPRRPVDLTGAWICAPLARPCALAVVSATSASSPILMACARSDDLAGARV